ncbi:hypothetical protein D1BOALGB6SA_6516 [Olavius sp. associated proteobacterium Delta 1]|nr:hypothetical protein D1BOALGB6SA_6516 [Olavius sp. associated proteobacterium Delta 1]
MSPKVQILLLYLQLQNSQFSADSKQISAKEAHLQSVAQ